MKIELGPAYKDLFATEKKWMTVLGLIVSMLIPIVGPMVAIGYLFRRFFRIRNGMSVEDFDFNYFGDYLKGGLWPVLSSMVAALIFIPVIFIAMIPMMLGPAIAPENEGLMIVLALVGFVLYLATILLMTLVTYPVMLRSGAMMDFKSGFSKTFVISFIKKVGMSLIGWIFLVGLVSIPFMLIGYLALFVGVYVVAAVMQFMMFHILFQHYDLFLERGGEPLQVDPELIKENAAPPIPNQAPPGQVQ